MDDYDWIWFSLDLFQNKKTTLKIQNDFQHKTPQLRKDHSEIFRIFQ